MDSIISNPTIECAFVQEGIASTQIIKQYTLSWTSETIKHQHVKVNSKPIGISHEPQKFAINLDDAKTSFLRGMEEICMIMTENNDSFVCTASTLNCSCNDKNGDLIFEEISAEKSTKSESGVAKEQKIRSLIKQSCSELADPGTDPMYYSSSSVDRHSPDSDDYIQTETINAVEENHSKDKSHNGEDKLATLQKEISDCESLLKNGGNGSSADDDLFLIGCAISLLSYIKSVPNEVSKYVDLESFLNTVNNKIMLCKKKDKTTSGTDTLKYYSCIVKRELDKRAKAKNPDSQPWSAFLLGSLRSLYSTILDFVDDSLF